MNAPSTFTRAALRGCFDNDVSRKGRICANVLAEARRLADQQRFGPLLNQLIARACELLDDIDEILIGLDPERDADDFATAAKLHREFEHIQAAESAFYQMSRF